MKKIPGWTAETAHIDVATHRLVPKLEASAHSEPLWRPTARAAALGTSLGLGASGTLLLGVWQIFDQLGQERASVHKEFAAIHADVSKALLAEKDDCIAWTEDLGLKVTTLQRLAGDQLNELENDSVQHLVQRITGMCSDSETVCKKAQPAFDETCVRLESPPPQDGALDYWHPPSDKNKFAVHTERNAGERVDASNAATIVAGDNGQASAPAGKEHSETATPAAQPTRPLTDCLSQDKRRFLLYTQIYSEVQRADTEQKLRQLAGGTHPGLIVATVDNVIATAKIRGTKRPVPWRQPAILIYHDEDRACAAQLLGAIPWPNGIIQQRRNEKAKVGTIELWLPSDTSQDPG
jgi:hypothetical protein